MIVSRTPLRISFAGGGSDLPEYYLRHDGAVVSTAIDRYVYVVVKERFDNKVRVACSGMELVDSTDELSHDIVRESLRKAGINSSIEVCTLADVPAEGSGLGSSSSLIVGLLNALYVYAGKLVTPEILARDACEIEMEVLNLPVGKQDAYIAAYGGFRAFRFMASGSVEVDSLALRPWSIRWLEENLMLFFTGRTRRAEEILTRQKESLARMLEAPRQLSDLAVEMRACMMNGLGFRFGELLDRGWEYKKSLAEGISDEELDGMYARALQAGALGGKISGAGGGGFMLLCCPPEKKSSVREELRDLLETPFRFEKNGSRTILSV